MIGTEPDDAFAACPARPAVFCVRESGRRASARMEDALFRSRPRPEPIADADPWPIIGMAIVTMSLFTAIRDAIHPRSARDVRRARAAIWASKKARESIDSKYRQWEEQDKRARDETNLARLILESREIHEGNG